MPTPEALRHSEVIDNLRRTIAAEREAERNTNTEGTSTMNTLTDTEYKEFAAWKESRIRDAARAEAQAEAAQVNVAQEAAADAAALGELEAKGFSLNQVFGHGATPRGRDVLALIHQSAFNRKSDTYRRLRNLARQQGLVV